MVYGFLILLTQKASVKEDEWLRDLMMDIPFTANSMSTILIHCDSDEYLKYSFYPHVLLSF